VAAGVAALAGRRAEAIAVYRDALRGWRALGLAFDEAMAILDMAILLAPSEAEMPEAGAAVAAAREILTRLDARPFIERLNAVPTASTAKVPGTPPNTRVAGQVEIEA
jgi:hypothetical protein